MARWRARRWGWGGVPVALLVLVAAMLALAACSRTPPEQRLRAQLEAMQAALEEGSSRDFMHGVAVDFAGNDGMDRVALQQMVRAQVLANARIGLSVGPAQVEIVGDRATVRFTAVATGGSGRFLPERAQTWEVTSGWRNEGGDWRLYYAQWTPR